MSSILDKVFEAADAVAHAHYDARPKDMITPTFIGLGQDGKIVVFETPFDGNLQKDIAAAIVRQVFRRRNVIAYAHVSEAWVSATANDLGARGLPYDPPAQQADRKEGVYINATDGTATHSRWYDITRDYAGRVERLTIDPSHAPSKESRFEGRFADLLK